MYAVGIWKLLWKLENGSILHRGKNRIETCFIRISNTPEALAYSINDEIHNRVQDSLRLWSFDLPHLTIIT